MLDLFSSSLVINFLQQYATLCYLYFPFPTYFLSFTVLLIPFIILLFILVTLFQIKKFAECLDPNANGKISFKDFCHGVFAIKGNAARVSFLIYIHTQSNVYVVMLFSLLQSVSVKPECNKIHLFDMIYQVSVMVWLHAV